MAGMQASSAVLPPVSTLLSQLKSLHSDDDKVKAADAPENGISSNLKELYEEIKQQDFEKILNGDDNSDWGAEIAAEIRCHLSACPFIGSHPHGVHPVPSLAYITLFCIFLLLIRADELYIETPPCSILFHCFVPLAKASSALPVSINLWLRQ